jgi:PLP dependent protein
MVTLPSIQTEFLGTATERRLELVRNRVQVAAERAGRKAESVRLVAVSRSWMVDPVLEVARTGVTDFAEEFVPEGVTKRPPVDAKVQNLHWHFTGTLVPKAMGVTVEFFDWIHSFDRSTLLRSLSEAVQAKQKRDLKVLIEVNPLGIQKRSGVSPDQISELSEGLVKIPRVVFAGLSFKSEASLSVADRLRGFEMTAKLASTGMELAMGTSQDFERAIGFGATIIRLGTAVFGPMQSSAFEDPTDL